MNHWLYHLVLVWPSGREEILLPHRSFSSRAATAIANQMAATLPRHQHLEVRREANGLIERHVYGRLFESSKDLEALADDLSSDLTPDDLEGFVIETFLLGSGSLCWVSRESDLMVCTTPRWEGSPDIVVQASDREGRIIDIGDDIPLPADLSAFGFANAIRPVLQAARAWRSLAA